MSISSETQSRSRYGVRAREVAAPAILMFLCLAVWDVAVRLLDVPAFVLPAPTAILATMVQDRALIFSQLQITMFEIVTGYFLAIIVGFCVSVAIVYSAAFRRGVLPLIVAAQTIPVIAIAPILVIWFGYNYVPRVIITALVAFFPLAISFVTGLRALEAEWINFFRSLNATPLQIFFKLRFPAALPNIFAGLKVATTLAVVGATISEWVGASAGLGYLMAQDSAQINTTRVFASLVVLGSCGMAFFAIISMIEWLTMPWAFGRLNRSQWRRRNREQASDANLSSTATEHRLGRAAEAEPRDRVTATLTRTVSGNNGRIK
jgi:ABC-type nitrate/sulfonate/bicarbonate transport system permease component